ncbi:NADH-quinone oxidoreductase subunit H [Caproiciproducens galactitolivorans]|uniref:Formate hydrogenlyase subunit 4 n=1 Tax=Caproiciproducens galactitolivorans TaxID=642589 RepID=A0A4Z0Y234_9FIRM|nr:complex I subunit 1 family protein [Caproiciproducens galactitolivorans]QEY35234.1 NADH-quinone oxidoreductase subunit H [Caproiciproducens galactitolivorans]TGJ76927.1 formate hydrogenlyase subunit 4 [Caproiciproducens galactitolivorans]
MGILKIALYLILAPFIGGFLAGIDRKIGARFQGRQGPPLLQPFYDLFKLFEKQSLVVNGVQDFFVGGYFIFILFTGCLFFIGGDLLLVCFALTLAEVFLMMAACSANSPYSAMGSQRELLQMMAYEPMLLLTAIGFYIATGSFMVGDIAQSSVSPIAYLPGMFFGFLYILTIKFRKSPFDISTSHHAHQEMVKGITTELSGNILALVELAVWYEDVLLLGMVGLFIVNMKWWSFLIAAAVCLLAYILETFVDNLFPRVKWDSMLKSTWLVTLVAGGVNLLILTLVH